jgi:hypothetical protein
MKYISFKEHLMIGEGSLAGNSRSGGMSKWEYYLVPNFNPKEEYSLEKKGSLKLYNLDFSNFENLDASKKIRILSVDLVSSGMSKYAHVRVGSNSGLLNINSIRKPSVSGDSGSVIGGGKNSKEFTPDKLSLGGIEFSDIGSMVSAIATRMGNVYGGDEYTDVRRYLNDIIQNTTGHSILNEAIKSSYKVGGDYNITRGDIMILSKNFGEVVGAMYLLKNKINDTVSVGFPASVKEGLYDVVAKLPNGKAHYYSVKSAGGSSTSMGNLDFITDNFPEEASYYKDYETELDAIDALINRPTYGTVFNIHAFFNDRFPEKVKKMTRILNNVVDDRRNQIPDIEQYSLDSWISYMRKNKTESTFIQTINTIYDDVLGDMKGTPRTTDAVQKRIFSSKKNFEHGYLLYPMGSYIVKYLNGNPRYLEALNLITSIDSLVSQMTVDMSSSGVNIKIEKFNESKFRFSYNGMSMKPGNRPIGFKKVK